MTAAVPLAGSPQVAQFTYRTETRDNTAFGLNAGGGMEFGRGPVRLFTEFRYFLTRLPARWGRLRGFFLLAFAGVVALTAAFAGLLWLGERGSLDPETWEHGYAGLNTLLVLWVALLVNLRGRQNPRRDWAWVWPVAEAINGFVM